MSTADLTDGGASPLLRILESAAADDLRWQDSALCAQVDPERWFPPKGGDVKAAKRICMACEGRAECLEYALENDIRFGIWGGKSERERRVIKRGREGMRAA